MTILFWGALFSSWIQSLVLEYKRKKSAFVLVEFNFSQMSDSPAHMHTKLLCCVNGKSVLKAKAPNICLCLYSVGVDSAPSERMAPVHRQRSAQPASVLLLHDKQKRTKKSGWHRIPCCGRSRFGGTTRKSDMLLFKLRRWYEGIGEVLDVRAGFYLICHMLL